MPDSDTLAIEAVKDIASGMTIGLGTGRAAARGIHALAQRVSTERLDLQCVATSRATHDLARSLGLRVVGLQQAKHIDYLFDGADEVDGALQMIKGRGGAMTREKIAAHAADRRIYLIQSSKLVTRLGELVPLPIEARAADLATVRRELKALGLDARLRLKDDGAPYETDNGHPVIDAPLPATEDLRWLHAALDAVPGVIGHGLFLTEADIVMIEDDRGHVSSRTRNHQG